MVGGLVGGRQFFFVFLDRGSGCVVLYAMIVIDFSNRVGSCQIFMCVVRVLPTFDLDGVTVSYDRLLWLEGAKVIVGDSLSG